MDIGPVGFQLPTLLPHAISPAEAKLHQSDPLPKDPYSELDTMPGLNSELYTLKVIKNIREEYRHGLDEYLELRKRNNVKEFTEYLNGNHYKSLGVENWVVGVVGLGHQVIRYTPDFLDALDREIKRLIDRVRSGFFVVLTDYPLEYHAHKVVETRHDPVHKIRVFYDEFSRLFDRGFQKIFVIVANKEFFSSYYFAKQAKHGMEHRVFVLDSQTFGLGLETLIDTSAAYIRAGHSEHEVLNYINERRHQMKYWVVALDIKRVKKKYWMGKLERERKKPFTSKQIPLLSLANSFDVVSTHTSRKIAFESLMRVVEDALSSSKNYTKIVVNADMYQLDFLSFLQGVLHRYPGLDLQITPMSSFLKKQFGDHVGICLI